MEGNIKISYTDAEVVIEGDKDGLTKISEICQRIGNLSESEAGTFANHFHISSDMGNAEKGSLPLVIIYNPEI